MKNLILGVVLTLYLTSNINASDNIKTQFSGKQIYENGCLYCHGETGMGDGIASKNPKNYFFPKNLNKIILTEEQVFLIAKHGAHYYGALKEDMPAWGIKFSDEELKAVAKYIKTTFKRENIEKEK